ncbi:hypothetical protein E4K10_04600 [Streptomyces sp. T1317-0309]|nr:hypothetical protein E4K10_04600 [Streptomyces sp. T1317-0309]
MTGVPSAEGGTATEVWVPEGSSRRTTRAWLMPFWYQAMWVGETAAWMVAGLSTATLAVTGVRAPVVRSTRPSVCP